MTGGGVALPVSVQHLPMTTISTLASPPPHCFRTSTPHFRIRSLAALLLPGALSVVMSSFPPLCMEHLFVEHDGRECSA